MYFLYYQTNLQNMYKVKETVKDKMKGDIEWNLRISGIEQYILDIYLMFLSKKIDIKLCQTYTKIHIYAIL